MRKEKKRALSELDERHARMTVFLSRQRAFAGASPRDVLANPRRMMSGRSTSRRSESELRGPSKGALTNRARARRSRRGKKRSTPPKVDILLFAISPEASSPSIDIVTPFRPRVPSILNLNLRLGYRHAEGSPLIPLAPSAPQPSRARSLTIGLRASIARRPVLDFILARSREPSLFVIILLSFFAPLAEIGIRD